MIRRKPHSLFKSPHAAQVHLVGMGGIGMSGIAEVLLNLGYSVSGSDLKESDLTRRLATIGARINYGHRSENLVEADVVVVSAAIRKDNPEVNAARHRKIPIIARAEMLAEQSEIGRAEPITRSFCLMPERIDQLGRTDLVQLPALLVGQHQVGCG